MGNALSVEVQELGSQDLTSTEYSIVDINGQESSDITEPSEDLTLSKENESIIQDQSSVQTDSAETKILDPSSELKEISLSEGNYISDESTLSEDSSVTEFKSITEKVPQDSENEIGVTENQTREIVDEEMPSPESSGKQEKKNLENSTNAELADLTDQTQEVNSEDQTDVLASVVKIPKSARRGTRTTASKTTRTRKKPLAKSDAINEEQSSPQLETEVSEISPSPDKADDAPDNQVESQPDEKIVASKVG